MKEWLTLLREKGPFVELLEFDVEDCFLNTPRQLVMEALAFWLQYPYSRRRVQCFAINKDGKAEDYVGKPSSIHFWELPANFVVAAVRWELEHNDLFEAASEDGKRSVLRQVKGLPIGGHLSAQLVELVALYREQTAPWPAELAGRLSSRYRDNFFVVLPPGAGGGDGWFGGFSFTAFADACEAGGQGCSDEVPRTMVDLL